MAFYFSATKLSFYDTSVFPEGSLPDDSVEVSDSDYADLMEKQNSGYVIKANASGYPYAVTQGCGTCSHIRHEIKKASATELGHVMVGDNLSIDEDGKISAPPSVVYRSYTFKESDWESRIDGEYYFLYTYKLDDTDHPTLVRTAQVTNINDGSYLSVPNVDCIYESDETDGVYVNCIRSLKPFAGKVIFCYANEGNLFSTGGGASDHKILADAGDSTAGYLADKIVSANPQTLSVSVHTDAETGEKKVALDVISDASENPLIQLNDFPNSTIAFLGSTWGDSGKEWGGGNQNTQVYCWKRQAKASGTLNRVSVCLTGTNTIQNFAAIRIGVFNSAGELLGATKYFRRDELTQSDENYFPTYGEQEFALFTEDGKSLHIDQGESYYIEVVARGCVIAATISNDANLYTFMLDYKFSRKISSLAGASWVNPVTDTGWEASYLMMFGALFQGV